MAIEPNAIFQQNQSKSQSIPTFLDKLHRVGIRYLNRVCFYKYTLILHRSQIFLRFFLKQDLRNFYDSTLYERANRQKTHTVS